MQIQFNGVEEHLDTALSLQELLNSKTIEGNFAIAVNQTFVPKSQYADTSLNDGDQIECVQAVQGG